MKYFTAIRIIGWIALLISCNGRSPRTDVKSSSQPCFSTEKNKLLGIWGHHFNENASFRIQKDSVYYPEQFKSYRYITKNDSLIILLDGWTYRTSYTVRNDSLFLKDKEGVRKYVRTVDTSDLKSWIKNFDVYYKNIEKQLYDSASAIQKDNIDFSVITLGLENRYHQCPDVYEKAFFGYKLAVNYYTHFESSANLEYRVKAKPLFISFLKFRNGEVSSQYLKLDTATVHRIARKWDSFSEKDQETIMRYGLLRGFGNGLPEILNQQ